MAVPVDGRLREAVTVLETSPDIARYIRMRNM